MVSLSSKASEVCQTALETNMHRNLQLITGAMYFSSVKRLLKTVTVVAVQ